MNKFKRWGYRIGGRFSAKTYTTKDDAKLALFDEFWATTQNDDRLWATDWKKNKQGLLDAETTAWVCAVRLAKSAKSAKFVL